MNDQRCPLNLIEAPCPIHGGPMPELELGPGGGACAGSDALPVQSDKFKFGTCNECNGMLMTDLGGNLIHVMPRPPSG